MDAQILQGEIEAVQEAVLSVDERLDAVEEQTAESVSEASEAASTELTEPVIDLAQVVGRLEAQVAQCLSELESLKLSAQSTQATAEAALVAAVTEPEPEPLEELTVTEVEAEPEPESESEAAPPKQPNWLERLLLAR